MTNKRSNVTDALQQRIHTIALHGLLSHWDELNTEQLQWLYTWMAWEETERNRRGLERRLRNARIGRFKPLVDFDWDWPVSIDRAAIADLMTLSFLQDATNVILLGGNGVGKSTIAQNIAHHAVLRGHTVLFTTAAQMLNELAAQDGDLALRRKLKFYAQPTLLIIDEVGYLSYSNRHADLLFEIINRRYENKSTVVTTNRLFTDWHEVFPNAACVVSLVDRLIHHAEIIAIDGESYRLKEAKEHTAQRQQKRAAAQNPSSKSAASDKSGAKKRGLRDA